jgi:hypothetical protein
MMSNVHSLMDFSLMRRTILFPPNGDTTMMTVVMTTTTLHPTHNANCAALDEFGQWSSK